MGNIYGVSDLSSSFRLARDNSNIKNLTFTAGNELASGKKGTHVIVRNGQSRPLALINNSLSRLQEYESSSSMAMVKLEAANSSLEKIRSTVSDVSLGILTEMGQSNPDIPSFNGIEAGTAFDTIVSTLNNRVNGESTFSGAETENEAISSSNTVLSDIENLILSSPDLNSTVSAINVYFDDPNGIFQTTVYSGSSVFRGPIEIGEDNAKISFNVKADDPKIKNAMKSLAIISAATNVSGALSKSDRLELIKMGAELGLTTNSEIISTQQTLGQQQEFLENAINSNDRNRHMLMQAKGQIENVDLYEAAAKFENFQVQLNSSYKVTARLLNLSFANYL